MALWCPLEESTCVLPVSLSLSLLLEILSLLPSVFLSSSPQFNGENLGSESELRDVRQAGGGSQDALQEVTFELGADG